MRLLLCFGLSLFLTNIISAKDFPKILDAPVKLSKSEQKKMDKANELINSGTALWNDVSKKYNSEEKGSKPEYRPAFALIRKAAELFLEGNYMKYEVYHKNCVDFWSKSPNATGLATARKFQKDASNYLEKAQSNRRAAENYVNEYSNFYNRFYEAISLEIIAAKKEGRALQFYQDWPLHFAYEFDDDIEVDLFDPNAKKEEPKKVEPVVAKVEAPKKVKPVEVKPKEEPKVIPDSLIIFYKVQIAAHTIRMTDKYLRDNIYKGNMKIDELHEDGWYKYTIGKFQTEEEANKLLREVKIPKAFVVAYKNGKRVPLKDANGSVKNKK
jgi:Sporulation related domain.